MKRKSPALAAFGLCGALFMTACSSSSASSTLSVSASFYPIAEIVRSVGGDAVNVQDLTPAGHDAHDTELTAKQLQRLEKSAVVFYFGDDFQPGSQKAIEMLSASRRIDVLAPIAQANGDPHVWLDPEHMISMTRMVQDQLRQLSPENDKTFASNSETYIAELSSVGKLIDTSFTRCESTTLATAHNSFGYFTRRAHLTSWPLGGYSPDQIASAKTLTQIATSLSELRVTTVYEEPSIPSDLVRQVAQKINGTVDSLNAVETITPEQLSAGIGYVEIMKDNIGKIVRGLRCS